MGVKLRGAGVGVGKGRVWGCEEQGGKQERVGSEGCEEQGGKQGNG